MDEQHVRQASITCHGAGFGGSGGNFPSPRFGPVHSADGRRYAEFPNFHAFLARETCSKLLSKRLSNRESMPHDMSIYGLITLDSTPDLVQEAH